MTERDETELEELFAEARGLAPLPGGDLMARILADAEREAASREVPAPAPPARAAWRDWLRALGGWPAVGGLAASALAGVWIGAAQPAGFSNLTALVWGDQVSVTIGVDQDPLSQLEG